MSEKEILELAKDLDWLEKNDKEGMKKVEESNRKKFEEKKKYNVKVPYLTFIVSFIISIIFVLVGMVT